MKLQDILEQQGKEIAREIKSKEEQEKYEENLRIKKCIDRIVNAVAECTKEQFGKYGWKKGLSGREYIVISHKHVHQYHSYGTAYWFHNSDVKEQIKQELSAIGFSKIELQEEFDYSTDSAPKLIVRATLYRKQ